MRSQTISIAAVALLSALPFAYAGKAKVYNHCDFPVYSWSVDTETNPLEPTIIDANGGLYEEDFRTPASGGVSIKLAPNEDSDCPITQLEYTVNYDLWYDVSNVDCTGTECPFQKHGLYLESGPGCPTVSCIPGNLTCHGAYTLWDDNWASLCCTEADSDAVLHLCRHSADGDDSDDLSDYQDTYDEPNTSSSYTQYVSEYVKPTSTYSESDDEPETAVAYVTQFRTAYVTVTPTAEPNNYDSSKDEDASDNYDDGSSDTYRARRRRHVHNHMGVHRHARR